MRGSGFYGEKNLVPCVTGGAMVSGASDESLIWRTACGPPVQKMSAGLPFTHQQVHSQ